MTSDPQVPPEGLEDFTPIKIRDFQCLACYAEFPTELLFQNHYLKEHTQENMCLVCGRDFTKRFLLRCHYQETHCCKEVYKCKNCDKVFNMVQKYWRHAVVHARHYVCNTCDRAFGIPSELKRHQMTVHADKCYFCVHCPETFTTAQDLRKHKESAHSLKSYNKKVTVCTRINPTILGFSNQLLPDLQINGVIKDDSKVIFFIFQRKCIL